MSVTPSALRAPPPAKQREGDCYFTLPLLVGGAVRRTEGVFRLLLPALFTLLIPSSAFAHSAERGFVLLLPTGFIITGGAIVVAATFALMASTRGEGLLRWFRCKKPLGAPKIPRMALSVIASLLLVFVICVGFIGTRDPLENLLPLTVWIGFWVMIVLLHPLIGNFWAAINPFDWTAALLNGVRPFPKPLAYWPSLLLFAGFAWFQLVYPSPENPPVLAKVISAYIAITLVASAIFGTRAWMREGDPFAPFLRFFALCAPLRWTGGTVSAQLPGAGLLKEGTLPFAAAFFVTAGLSAISFDALAATFWWQGVLGENPLEYPGRTALMLRNSIGLVMAYLLLLALLTLAVWAGKRWSGHSAATARLLPRFVLAMLPISAAFHFSHYLTELLVNGQYLWAAWMAELGLTHEHARATTSFLNTASGAWTIYAIQTTAIVLGHVVSIVVAHAMALDEGLRGRQAIQLEAPTALLMVAYTGFGLWLLSTPTVA